MNNKKELWIEKYSFLYRCAHWIMVILFLLTIISGFTFYHPSLFFLSNLIGGSTWARILHPFFGIFMAIVFFMFTFKLMKHNKPEADDLTWLKNIKYVFLQEEEKIPPVGHYNAGQKIFFWNIFISLFVLFITGIIIWRSAFSEYFSTDVIRIAVLLHAASATYMVLNAIVHIYAAIIVKGSILAMTYGKVPIAWARSHHAKWVEHLEKTQQL